VGFSVFFACLRVCFALALVPKGATGAIAHQHSTLYWVRGTRRTDSPVPVVPVPLRHLSSSLGSGWRVYLELACGGAGGNCCDALHSLQLASTKVNYIFIIHLDESIICYRTAALY
jgi:hypothetical protein